MKIKNTIILVSMNLFFTTYVYADCQAMRDAIAAQRTLKDQMITNRATSWTNYTSYCGAGGATSNKGEKGGKGKGNMCAYYNSGEFRWVHKGNTLPVGDCGSLSCFDGNVLGYVFGALDVLFSYTGLDQITDSVSVDQGLTNNCKTYCEEWKTYDSEIPKIESTIRDLQKNEATLCPSPCTGLQGDVLDKCECDRKDKSIWSWDATKKDCVACKDKEGTGEAYQKCLCENVQEGVWDIKDKNCYGKSCAGKTGDDFDKCVCEIEKKGVWNKVKKTCNYVPEIPSGPQTGGDDTKTGTSTGLGYTAEGAAASDTGTSSSGSGASGGSEGFWGDAAPSKNEGAVSGSKKKAGSSWYKNLLGSMGFGSYGNTSSTGYESASSGSGVPSKSSAQEQAKKGQIVATDIGKKDTSIFASISQTYEIRSRSGILSSEGTASSTNMKTINRGTKPVNYQ